MRCALRLSRVQDDMCGKLRQHACKIAMVQANKVEHPSLHVTVPHMSMFSSNMH